MECPDAVKRLIERFNHQSDQVRSLDYNETQLRIDFINPLFAALGWDMDNAQGYAEQYREVVHEDRIKVYGATKAPDYSFRIGGVRKFFLEAKKPAINIKQAWEPAYQLRRYAWSAKLPVSILTDFEELAIYDCRIAPKQMDKPATARREYITYTDYCNRWDFLYGTFSKDAVLKGDFDRYCASQKGRGAQEFDDAFLIEIEEWRKKLASNLALRNDLSEHDLNFATQRIIDRVIFLRICEDRGVEPTGHLQQLLNGDNTYKRLVSLFREADARYNSGLFHFKRETGREEAPDELTLDLEVDDAALKTILKRLYYPESPYEFTVVSADILGSVYERFLGNIIERRGEHGIKVVEKPEVRKAGGVYYTPTYIVDYIVKQTVGKLLEGRTPKEAAKLKVLDPACGSGSFLLGAYQYLLDWHLKWYVADGPQKWSKAKTATIRPADKPSLSAGNAASITLGSSSDASGAALTPEQSRELGHWALTIAERKRILLDNIHGVDIDYQAVEVTKLSLLLRCLEGETAESVRAFSTLFRERALPDLGRNIQCGNSLIGTDIMTTEAWKEMSEEERSQLNPFDYERAFERVFRRGRFDAVIGNPPYLFITEVPETVRWYYEKNFSTVDYRFDLYGAFIEKSAHRLLRKGAVFGFIIPHTLLSNDSFGKLRSLLAADSHIYEVVDLGPGVFANARNETMLLLFEVGHGQGDLVTVRRCEPAKFPVWDQEFRVTQNVWASKGGAPWLTSVSPQAASLLKKLEFEKPKLGEFCTINQGMRTGDNERLLSSEKRGRGWVPVVGGKDVGRYAPLTPTQYVHYDPPRLDAPRRREIFESAEKIVVQEIRNISLHRRIVATLDRARIFCLQSTNVINRRAGVRMKLSFLLAILNSRLINEFFRLSFPGNNHIPSNQLARIPIALPDRVIRERFSSLAESILSLHASEAAAKSPQQKEQMRRRIDATDRQIDQLVYHLYGLTDDEIRLVEQSTQSAGD